MFVVDAESLKILFRENQLVLAGTLPNSSEEFEARIGPTVLKAMGAAYTAMRLVTRTPKATKPKKAKKVKKGGER